MSRPLPTGHEGAAPTAPGALRAGLRDAWGELRAALSLRSLPRAAVWAFLAVQLASMFWDLPSSHGWENDGAAPRDFLGGIADNLRWGHAHRYPLFHYLAIGALSAPVLLADAVAAALTGAPIAALVTSVPSMTAIALATKALHAGMMLVALASLARSLADLFGVMAARWGAVLAMLNLSVAYYGRTTNVDAAYLMWVALGLEQLCRLARERSPRQAAAFAAFAAAAVATKDQAYAAFTLPLLALAAALVREGGVAVKRLGLGRALGLGACLYAVLSGAALNPSGFLARLALLTGTNSQDWRQYPATLAGAADNTLALWHGQAEYWWPWPVVGLAWLGVALAPRLYRRRCTAAATPAIGGALPALLPLASGLGSTVAFTLLVGRAEHRFMLPLGFWLGGYAGVCLASLDDAWRSPRGHAATQVLGALCCAAGLVQCAELAVTQWYDPRREVERFLASLPPECPVETYGLAVYLPRFELASKASVTRVSPVGASESGPIPGLAETHASYMDIEARRPDVVVAPAGFVDRFRAPEGGRGPRPAMSAYRDAPGALEFFERLTSDRLPHYHLSSTGDVRAPAWFERVGGSLRSVHGSTGRKVWVAVRDDGCAPLPSTAALSAAVEPP
jgi:hypothetical protein